MRAPMRPSTTRAFSMISLLLGGTLLIGTSQAWGLGSVTFTQMTVERCEERGACEWKLSCGVGANPQETELLKGESARTKYSVKINRSLDVAAFPTTVHCTAWEDDGFFSESWEKLATASVDLPAGGNFQLFIGNKDQGTVRVVMVADSLELGIAPPPPPATPPPAAKPAKGKAASKPAAPAPLQLVGAFNPSLDGHAVVIGLEWKAFKDTMDRLAAAGIQLEDIETFQQGGKRLWNGIFRNSADEVKLLVDMEGKKFDDSWKKLTGSRMRLTDLEVYETGGKYTYAGIFRNLGETHALWHNRTRQEFEDKVKELAEGKGLRLLDFEVYQIAGKLVYDGTFRASPRETQLWTGLDQAAFLAKVQGLAGKEWEVVDVETYKDGKARFFDAIVRAGATGSEIVMAPDVDAFAKRWHDLVVKGKRLVSLEAYRD
jgi:polyglycine hydrolase-like protein